MPTLRSRPNGTSVDANRMSHSVSNRYSWLDCLCLTLIRTVNIISLLDCAFFFYQNYPCRLTHAEMECELPCEESLFQSDHPFSEPNFRFTRNITMYEAFQNLFDSPSNDSPRRSPETSPMDLTVLDMFILIHSKRSTLSPSWCT